MQVTMLTTMCGPNGNAFPGMTLNLKNDDAQEMLKRRFARPYDADRDRRAKKGPIKYRRPE